MVLKSDQLVPSKEIKPEFVPNQVLPTVDAIQFMVPLIKELDELKTCQLFPSNFDAVEDPASQTLFARSMLIKFAIPLKAEFGA